MYLQGNSITNFIKTTEFRNLSTCHRRRFIGALKWRQRKYIEIAIWGGGGTKTKTKTPMKTTRSLPKWEKSYLYTEMVYKV